MNEITITGDNLVDYIKTINSKDDFIKFLEYLNIDFELGKNHWENDDLKSFLDGMLGFTQAIDGYYKNTGETIDTDIITWRMFAEILLAAKVYE